jgi:fumarate reductase subunit C
VSARREAALWVAQRGTAVILAVCVAVHLVTIVYAVRNGLSAAEILARTRASVGWAAFYAVFVISAAIHGAIGLRAIAAEWLGFRGEAAEVTMTLIGLALTVMGLRGVAAVIL